MLAAALEQTLATDRCDEPFRSAVIQPLRRRDRPQPEFDLDGMPLIRTNAASVVADRETLLVVVFDDCIDQRTGQRLVALRQTDQVVDIDPACIIQGQADDFGLVAQNEADGFAGGNKIIHCSILPIMPPAQRPPRFALLRIEESPRNESALLVALRH